MGYAGYFLIVADFVRFAREQRIATTCRGSAPGSIVTYTLGITPVDPIAYQLPFERFLNPDRVTMPDIDVDFEDARRDEVINYVTRKYGQDHVAQIITFGTMLARAAIRDVGPGAGARLQRGGPDRQGGPQPAGHQAGGGAPDRPAAARDDREATRRSPSSSRSRSSWRASRATPPPTRPAWSSAGSRSTELMPLQKATNSDALMTQYEMHGVEALGLLKFDFLGLSNLTILRQAVDLISEHRGIPRIDLDHIPLDDAQDVRAAQLGRDDGRVPARVRGDAPLHQGAAAHVGLRPRGHGRAVPPGPMDNIPAYIRRKHGLEPVTYLHPLLEPYLEKTYGVFVYQEDIMAAAIALGGFTGPEADTLGYAIRKKKSAVLRSMKDKFVTQAAERGVARGHHRRGVQGVRAVRALRLQQGARHLLRPDRVPDRVPQGELHRRVHGQRADGLPGQHGEGRGGDRRVPAAGHRRCEPPDVLRSGLHFTVEGEAIRFGLLAIKNVGGSAIESIIRRARPAVRSARSRTCAPGSTCGWSTSACWSR